MAFRNLRKIISLCLIFCFFSGEIGRANPLIAELRAHDFKRFQVTLPETLGTVGEVFVPKTPKSSPFIFQVQTAHSHYQSTQKVRDIILYLQKQYNAKLIFAEGASEALRPEYLQFFQDPKKNQKMLDTLAQKGLLTGVDLALMTPSLRAFGIEDPLFYRPAFKTFKKVIKQKKVSQNWVDAQKHILETEISKVFSPSTRKLFQAWKKFQADQQELQSTVRFLKSQAEERMDLDLSDPLSQFEWPHLTRLVLIGEIEKKITPEALEKEKQKIKENFKPKGSDLMGQTPSVFSRETYRNFLNQAIPKGYRFKDYPQFTYHMALQILRQEIQASPFFKELHGLFDKLFQTTQSAAEKKLLDAYREILLTEKLLKLELTREEWEVLAGRDEIVSSSGLTGGSMQELKGAYQFYELTEKREQAFFTKVSEKLKLQKEKVAILVTGGFHTPGLSQQFKENNIGYAVMTPTLTEDIDSNLYHKIMLAQAHMEHPELAHPPTLGDEAYYRSESRIVKTVFDSVSKSAPESLSFSLSDSPYAASRAEARTGSRVRKKRPLKDPRMRNSPKSEARMKESFSNFWKAFSRGAFPGYIDYVVYRHGEGEFFGADDSTKALALTACCYALAAYNNETKERYFRHFLPNEYRNLVVVDAGISKKERRRRSKMRYLDAIIDNRVRGEGWRFVLVSNPHMILPESDFLQSDFTQFLTKIRDIPEENILFHDKAPIVKGEAISSKKVLLELGGEVRIIPSGFSFKLDEEVFDLADDSLFEPAKSQSEARSSEGALARTRGFQIARGEIAYPQDANPENPRVGDFFFHTVKFPGWIQLRYYDPESDEVFLFLGYRNEEDPQELRMYLMGDFVTGKAVLGKATGRFNEDSPIQFEGYFPEELKGFVQKLHTKIAEATLIETSEMFNRRPLSSRPDQVREYRYFFRGTNPSEKQKIKLKLYLWGTHQQKIVVQLGSEKQFTLPFRPMTANDKDRKIVLTDSQRRLYFQGRYHDRSFQLESDHVMDFLAHVSKTQKLEKGFGRILDIGGKNTPFSRDIENRDEVVVLDLGAPDEPYHEADVLFVQGNAENLNGISPTSRKTLSRFLGIPSPDETAPIWHSFETVILSFVLNYADYQKILQELAAKTKPGTRVIIQNYPHMGDKTAFSPQGVKTNRELIETLEEGAYEIETIHGYSLEAAHFTQGPGDFLSSSSTPSYLQPLTSEEAKTYDGILFISLKRVDSKMGRSESRVLQAAEVEEVLAKLVQLPPDFDWKANWRKIPNLVGFRFKLNRPYDGSFEFQVFPGYRKQIWSVRGSKGGDEIFVEILSQTVERGFLKLTVKLTSEEDVEGQEPLIQTFYLGRYTKKLKVDSRKDVDPDTLKEQLENTSEGEVLDFFQEPARRVLGEMVEQPKDFNWEEGQKKFPSLVGAYVGTVSTRGGISFLTHSKPNYQLQIPNLDYEKWKGAKAYIVKEHYQKNFYQFTLELRNESEETHQETFQIGNLIRRNRDGTLDKNNHLLVSHELGLHILGTIVIEPFDFERKVRSGEIPELVGLRLGTVRPQKGLGFNPIPSFYYPFTFGEPEQEGSNAVIKSSETKGVVLEFDVDFEAPETDEVLGQTTLQMSPDFTKWILGINKKKGERIKALEMSPNLLAKALKRIVNHPPGEPFNENSDIPRTEHLIWSRTDDDGLASFVPKEYYSEYSLSFAGQIGKSKEEQRGWLIRGGKHFLGEGVLNVPFSLTKGEETAAARYQVSPFFTRTLLRNPEKGEPTLSENRERETYDFLHISAQLATSAFRELVLLTPRRQIPSMVGLDLGKLDSKGSKSFKIDEEFNYTFAALGRSGHGGHGKIISDDAKESRRRIQIRYEMPSEPPRVRTYQLGPNIRRIKSEKDPKKIETFYGWFPLESSIYDLISPDNLQAFFDELSGISQNASDVVFLILEEKTDEEIVSETTIELSEVQAIRAQIHQIVEQYLVPSNSEARRDDETQKRVAEVLGHMLQQPPDYDWEKNPAKVPSLQGIRFKLNVPSTGAFEFQVFPGYRSHYWPLRGSEKGNEIYAEVLSQTVERGFLKLTVALTSEEDTEGQQALVKTFYLGRYTKKLNVDSRRKQDSPKFIEELRATSGEVLEFLEVPARRVLGEMVEQPVDFDWEEGKKTFPSLLDSFVGKVRPGGTLSIYTGLKPNYTLQIPDIDKQKWEGADVYLVKEKYQKNFYQFTLELRHESGETHRETFQIGNYIRRRKDGSLDKNKHLLISHELGLHIIGGIVIKPESFEEAITSGKVPDLSGLKLGRVRPRQILSFNPISEFRYPWSIWKVAQAGDEAVITKSKRKGVVLEFDVEFENPESGKVAEATYQMSPDFTRGIPGVGKNKGKRKKALEISSSLLALALKRIVNHPVNQPFTGDSDIPRTEHLILSETDDDGDVRFSPETSFQAYSLALTNTMGKTKEEKSGWLVRGGKNSLDVGVLNLPFSVTKGDKTIPIKGYQVSPFFTRTLSRGSEDGAPALTENGDRETGDFLHISDYLAMEGFRELVLLKPKRRVPSLVGFNLRGFDEKGRKSFTIDEEFKYVFSFVGTHGKDWSGKIVSDDESEKHRSLEIQFTNSKHATQRYRTLQIGPIIKTLTSMQDPERTRDFYRLLFLENVVEPDASEIDSSQLDAFFEQLGQLNPQNQVVVHLILEGYTDEEIASETSLDLPLIQTIREEFHQIAQEHLAVSDEESRSESRGGEEMSKWFYVGALYVAAASASAFVMAKTVLQTPDASGISYIITLFLWANVWMLALWVGQTIYKRLKEKRTSKQGFYWTLTPEEFHSFLQLKRTDKVLILLNALMSQFLAPFLFIYSMQTSLLPQVFAILYTAGAGAAIFVGAYIFGKRMGIESERLRVQHIVGLGLLAAGTGLIVTMIGLQQTSGDWLSSILWGLGSAVIAAIQPILQKYIIMVRNKDNQQAQKHLPLIMTKMGYALGFTMVMLVFLFFTPKTSFFQFYNPHPFIPVLSFIFASVWMTTYQIYKRMPLPDFVLIRSSSPFWAALVEFFWLHRALSLVRSVSGGLILAGAWIASWGTYKSQQAAQEKKSEALSKSSASANSEARTEVNETLKPKLQSIRRQRAKEKDSTISDESGSEIRSIPWIQPGRIPISYRTSVALMGMANPGWDRDLRKSYQRYLTDLIHLQFASLQASGYQVWRHTSLFDQIAFAVRLQDSFKLVRGFAQVPQIHHPEVQALIQMMSRYRHAYVVFHLKGADEKTKAQFESDFRKAVRKQTGQKKLNLRVVTRVAEYRKFLQESNYSRNLIFGDLTVVQSLFKSLDPKTKARTLFIEEDIENAESLTEEAEALLAALDELFRLSQLPKVILSGTRLLVQKVQFVEEIRTLFSQAA